MRILTPTVLILAALTSACRSVPRLPDGEGPGVIAFDPAPLAGAQTWDAPEWHVGDRYKLLRGGMQTIEFRVTERTDAGYTLVDAKGTVLRRGLDLSNIGEFTADGQARHVLSPPDTRFHWPLWVGKRWRCKYVDRTAGTPNALPIEAAYEVEDLDRIETPAGTFDALRIVRTSRLELEGNYLDRVTMIWYCPEIGQEVRQVFGDTSVQLVEWSPASGESDGGTGAVEGGSVEGGAVEGSTQGASGQ